MSEGTRYLDGFLAAVHPGNDAPGVRSSAPAVPAAPDPDLSVEEAIKRRLHPLDSFPRLLECVAANRPPETDDQFRFQWFGLFYQAPRQDAFHLRLRLPGGRLQAFQLAGLAEIVQRCAAGYVLLNAQGALDLPGVPLPMAAEILRRVEGIGLNARQTGGDCVQSIRGGEGGGWQGAGTVHALVCALEQALAHHRRLADLPRPCEIIFQAADEPLASDLNTLVLREIAAESSHPSPASEAANEGGFLLVLPGCPEGGWWLPASQVVPGCLALLEAWAVEADRSRRQDAGLGAYCLALPRDRVSLLFDRAEWRPLPLPARTTAVAPAGFAVPDGRLLSGQLQRIERIVREQGLPGVRLVRGCLHLPAGVDADVNEAIGFVLNRR